MQGVRGTIGKQVVFRTIGGKTFISAYPDMTNINRSPKQKKQNNRMTVVNKIIAEIKADAQLRAESLLRLDLPSNKLHHALLSEQMRKLSQQG